MRWTLQPRVAPRLAWLALASPLGFDRDVASRLKDSARHCFRKPLFLATSLTSERGPIWVVSSALCPWVRPAIRGPDSFAAPDCDGGSDVSILHQAASRAQPVLYADDELSVTSKYAARQRDSADARGCHWLSERYKRIHMSCTPSRAEPVLCVAIYKRR